MQTYRWFNRGTILAVVVVGLAAWAFFTDASGTVVAPAAGQPLAQEPTPTPTCAPPPAGCTVARAYGQQLQPTTMVPAFDQAAQNDPNTANARPGYPAIARAVPTPYPGGTGITYVSVSPQEPIPAIIPKAMGWVESTWHQFDAGYGAGGCTLVSSSCDYGTMQVNQASMGGMDSGRIVGEYPYNIGAGTRVLIGKWNWMSTSTYRLISPNSHTLAENWYYAVAAYNGWASDKDPNSSSYNRERAPFDGTQLNPAANYPYQEIIWGYMAHPANSLWVANRVPWVPRGIWGSWQAGDWRPAEWTPRPTFYYLPDIRANSNGSNSYIVLQNPRGDYTLAADVAFYNQDGTFNRWWLEPAPSTLPYIRLAPRSSRILTVTDVFPGIGFTGSAVLFADVWIAAIAKAETTNTYAGGYTAVGAGATLLYAPVVLRSYYTFNTNINIQNADSSPINVYVTYYNNTGTPVATETSLNLPVGGRVTFDQSTNPNLSTNFNGSAMITANGQMVSVINQKSTNKEYTYNGIPSGASRIYAPVAMKNYYGFNTSMQVQNVGTAATNITVSYSDGVVSTANYVQPRQAAMFVQSLEPHTNNWAGSATISTSNGQPLVGITNQASSTESSAHNHVSSGAREWAVPFLEKHHNGYSSAIQIMNITEYLVGCTVNYGDGIRVVAWIHTNGSITLAQANEGHADGWVGSATISCTEDVVIISNNGPDIAQNYDRSTSYNAIPQ